jgi:hypothetical protein
VSPADVELMKGLALIGIEIGKAIADLASGKRPQWKRIRERWATVEQLAAKAETDDAERERWPDGDGA